MATNTSKTTLGQIYRWVSNKIGTQLTAANLAAGITCANYHPELFVEDVNDLVRELAGEVEMLHRFYILRPDTGLMRYIKYTRDQGDAGIIRFNLDGQTATNPSGASDVDCLGGQYEKICTGEGVDFSPVGDDTPATLSSPDIFPGIYLPAEAAIDPTIYDPTSEAARIRGPHGMSNTPSVPALLDIKYSGWSTGDITSDHYPTADQEDNYFIDPYLIAALQLILYTTGTDFAVPRSADAYLNDTWATILGLDGTTVASAVLLGSFVMDGVTWAVTVPASVAGGPHTIRITGGGQIWDYTIIQTQTPWQTVTQNATIWTTMFSQTQNHSWYLKFDQQRIKLPDDIDQIMWVWKVPVAGYYDSIQVDSDDDNVLTSYGDDMTLQLNPEDQANHYFPITEGMFTKIKWSDLMGSVLRNYAGFYIQLGQQLYIYPKHTDPIAIYAKVRPDLADSTTTVDGFDSIYLEIPAIAIDCIKYKLLADHYASSNIRETTGAQYWLAMYERAKKELKDLFMARQGQMKDGPSLRQRLESQRNAKFFHGGIRPRTRRFDQY